MKLLITNLGIFYEDWNDNLKEQIVTPISKGIHHYYNYPVLFADELTVEGFLNTLYQYKTILEDDFVSYTNGFCLQPYYDELQKTPSNTELNYTSIVLKHTCSISVHHNLLTNLKTNHVNSWNTLSGIEDISEAQFSLSFEKLNDIKHLKLKLETLYDLWCFDPSQSGAENKLLHKDLIHEFTLHEILTTFLTELTYYCHPSDISLLDKLIEDECDNIKSFDELINETEPVEALLIKWLQQDLQIALKDENFEACSRIQSKINEHQTTLNKILKMNNSQSSTEL